MGSLGPMAGHNHHFPHYAPEKLPYAVDRYVNEPHRLYGVLNKPLASKDYIANEHSIADMACYPWIKTCERQGQDLNNFPLLKAWFIHMSERSAVQRAYAKAELVNASAAVTQQGKSILFGQKNLINYYFNEEEIMSIILYDLAAEDTAVRFSPHCWKSRLALSHKQLEHATVPVAFTEKNKIAMSGQGLLPVLADGDAVVHDSWDIAVYLESKYPQRPALFANDDAKSYAMSVNEWCNNVLSVHIRPLVIMPIFKIIKEEDKNYFRQSREEKLGVSLEAYNDKAKASIAELNKTLDTLREVLDDQYYLTGLSPSYADICILGMFLWIACSNEMALVDMGFTDQEDTFYHWYQRMLNRYSDVIPSRLL
jgi:glutathione S-transferase